MKQIIVLAGLALAVAVPFSTSFSEQVTMGTGPATVDQLAPDIQISSTINGDGRTSLADFRGEVVFLEIWGTH